jgi:pimeloyl-ACP methyl ester carboxylesterase
MGTWIFLRGLMRESRHWGAFVPLFERAFPNDKIVLLDLPGNGVRNAEKSPLTVIDMVEDCRAQLTAMGLKPPYCLFTISMGGMVAVQWSSLYPREVRAQVLINTSMRPFSPIHHRLRPANYLAMLRMAIADGGAQVREEHILRMTANFPHEGVVQAWEQLNLRNPVAVGNAVRQLWAAARFSATKRSMATPTLILVSDKDRLVSSKCSMRIAGQWKCALKVHYSAGHDLPLDDAAWVVESVAVWCAQQPAAPLAKA